MTTIPYKPYLERIPDTQYTDLLRFIKRSDQTFLVKHPHQVRKRWTNLITPNLVFNLRNGFPIITERKISFWKKPITEMILFLRGVQHLDKMIKAGCGWWKDWVSPEQCAKFGLESGDLGPGSYGPILHNFPHFEWGFDSVYHRDSERGFYPKPFNQIEHLVQSLKDGPGLNTHVVTTWFPPFAMQHSELGRQVVVAPCHGTVIQCTVIDGKRLVLTMVQRSGDVPVGVVSNIIQYAALTIMLAHICGYEPYQFIHKINDAQIYEDQIGSVNELLAVNEDGSFKRPPFRFPTLQLTEHGQAVEDIFDFTADHFELSDYQYHPPISVPTTL